MTEKCQIASDRPPYLPFVSGKWRMVPGLVALDLSTWIEIDQALGDELALKEQLLQERYPEVFASLPGSELAQAEVLESLLTHLCHYFPQYYDREENQIRNLVTQQVWKINDFEAAPLDLAGRLVQEDLCLLRPGVSGYELVAASVCFPSRWRLADKMGRCLGQIHAPVPGYAEKLSSPVDRFFEQLKVDRPVWRMNWSIADSPDLFLPPKLESEPLNTTIDASNVREKLWIRTERQTLRRLAKTGNILFTIRTHLYPFHVLEAYPDAANGLLLMLQQVPIETQLYKSLVPFYPVMLGYLTQLQDR
jgi:dimethylamine monooxygenase subunit A